MNFEGNRIRSNAGMKDRKSPGGSCRGFYNRFSSFGEPTLPGSYFMAASSTASLVLRLSMPGRRAAMSTHP